MKIFGVGFFENLNKLHLGAGINFLVVIGNIFANYQ